MAEQKSEEMWRHADEEVRKNLPPGVKLVRTLRGHTDLIGRIAWSPSRCWLWTLPLGRGRTWRRTERSTGWTVGRPDAGTAAAAGAIDAESVF